MKTPGKRLSETRLRAWAAGRMKLGPRAIPTKAWSEVTRLGLVEAALAPDGRKHRGRLLRELAVRLFPVGPRGPADSGPDSVPRSPDELIPAHELMRAEILSEHLAREARSEPEIGAFRDRLLGGRPIARDLAGKLMKSPAPSFLDQKDFGPDGIPLIGHESEIDWDQRGIPPADGLLKVSWPTGRREFPVERLPEDAAELVVKIGAAHSKIQVRRGSAFDDLRRLSARIGNRYLWDKGEVAGFILTGGLPHTRAISVRSQIAQRGEEAQFRVELLIQPWVSARTVERVYRQLQWELLGAENRPLKPQSLDLFRFVVSQESVRSWRNLLEAWNSSRKDPNQRYKPDEVGNFHRDYERVRDRLLGMSLLAGIFSRALAKEKK